MNFLWIFLCLALVGGVILMLRSTINRPSGERKENPYETPRES